MSPLRYIRRLFNPKFLFLFLSLLLFIVIVQQRKVNNVSNISINSYNDKQEIPPIHYDNSLCMLPSFRAHIPVLATETYTLNCDKNPNIVNIFNGKFVISSSNITISCSYKILKRIDDFNTVTSDSSKTFQNGDPIPSDYFTVTCSDSRPFSNSWTMPLVGIKPQIDLIASRSKVTLSKNAFNSNVILLGFDSVSRLSFMKNLPKTFEIFTKELNGVVFQKHNIIGDGTTANVMGFLTGHVENDFHEARKSKPNSKPIDDFPFIFKNFKKSGYVTLFAEDQQDYGTFQYRLLGFSKPPTDHYTRPYFSQLPFKQRCLGSIPQHNVMFNILKEYYRVYGPDVRKFGHLFQADSSHNSNDHLHPIDDDLVSVLREFKSGGLFDNTILILLSDHGARFSADRSTVQGKFEERLPFLGIYLPDKLRENKPELMKNLRQNSELLTSHYDIYATLLHILDEPRPRGLKSISLMDAIPSTRSCSDIPIEPHWCTCSRWQPLPSTHPISLLAGEAAVKYINDLLRPFTKLCSKLHLKKVTSIEFYEVNNAVLKFKKSADDDGYSADLSDNMKVPKQVYRVTFLASPGDAFFEATGYFDVNSKLFTFQDDYISRINRYGNLIACLGTTYPHMRKFCICNSAL